MASRTDQMIVNYRATGVSQFEQAANRANSAMHSQTKAASALHQQLQFMRGGLGQVGHQIQDIAVQAQMGTNGLIILGQQGSQIASLFGAQGAIIGAILALGAAIGTAFLPELFKTKDAVGDLEKAMAALNLTASLGDGEILNYSESIERLGKVSEIAVKGRIAAAITGARAATKASAEGVLQAFDTQFDMGTWFTDLEDAVALASTFGSRLGASLPTGVGFMETSAVATDLGKALGASGDEAKALGKEIIELIADLDHPVIGGGQAFIALEERLNSIRSSMSSWKAEKVIDPLINAIKQFTDGAIEADQIVASLEKGLNIDITPKYDIAAQNEFLSGLQKQVEYYGASKSILDVVKAVELGITGEKLAQVRLYGLELEALDEKMKKEQAYQALVQKGVKLRLDYLLTEAEQSALNYEMQLEQMKSAGATEQELMAAKQQMNEQFAMEQFKSNEALMASMQVFQQAGVRALSTVIKEGGNLKDALRAVGDTIVTSLIGAFVNMAANYIAQKTAMMLFDNTATTAQLAKDKIQASAISAMFATPAALVSLATSGANAIPAQAGIASTVGLAATLGLSSFEGGGYTGSGARTGGMDGKGGFLAMVHPNETIIDHEKSRVNSGSNFNYAPVINGANMTPKQIMEALNRDRKRFTRMVQASIGVPA